MEHLKFENTEVFNFGGAFRGMRNPKNSWHLSDSVFGLRNFNIPEFDEVSGIAKDWTIQDGYQSQDEFFEEHLLYREEWLKENGTLKINPIQQFGEVAYIGPKDMNLAQRLIRGGPEHRKFLRQIQVCVDITAPLYWWKEFDTYKVGTVANSTSTMHKLAETPITRDCFLLDKANDELNMCEDDLYVSFGSCVDELIDLCEKLRQKYNKTKDIRYWRALIQLLPNAWVQKRTVTMNYENLLAICSKSQRRNHKLPEWREDFICWARELPYAQDLIFLDEIIEDKNS